MAERTPYIAVVIPLYNKEKYVKRAIDSVLAQSRTDYEVIVVNDGSTDDGPEIVRQMRDDRVRMVDQPNAGVSAARNRGIREARSELVAFLDADDEWLPPFLETIVEMARRYPEAGAYATGYRLVKGQGDVCRDITIGGDGVQCGCYFDLTRRGVEICSASSTAVRRRVFDRAGTFRVGYRLGEDLDMWFRIGLYYPLACSPRICALYHYYPPDPALPFSTSKRASPLYMSFLQVAKEVHMDPVVREKAHKHLSYQLKRDIEYVFARGARDIAMLRLQLYRRRFGVDMLFLKLGLLNMVPPVVLRLLSEIRLACVQRVLQLRSAVGRSCAQRLSWHEVDR